MKRQAAILICVVVAIVSILVVIGLLSTHINVPKNDPFVVGNTGGNLSNNGLFAECDGVVYFANHLDGNAIYSMDPYEGNYKKISASGAQSLNVDGNRIYYSMTGPASDNGLGYIRKAKGLYSVNINGTKPLCYTQDAVGIIALSGNNLYYQHYTPSTGTYLDTILINKEDNKTVVDQMVSPASINSGYIYYSGVDGDMYLYRLDTASNTSTCIFERNMYQPIYHNGDIYYIDLDTNYHLCKYNLTTGENTTLVSNRVDMFNVYGNIIYYQSDSSKADAALMRIGTDGMSEEFVLSGIYCDINITSQYVYFHPYDDETAMYHQSLYGSVNVTPFMPEVLEK